MLNYQDFISQNTNTPIQEEKKEKVHEYGCVMLFFDFPEVEDIHTEISEDDIFTDPNDPSFGLEKEPHCTLLYGLHEEVDDSTVEKILADFKFGECSIGNASLFENDDFDVLKFDVSGDSLHTCNKELTALPHTNKYPDYHPHMTIAYLNSGAGKKYVEKLKGLEYVLVPTHAVYSKTDGSKVNLKINKQ